MNNGIKISENEYPGLLQTHLCINPTTAETEKEGQDLKRNNLEDWNQLQEFIKHVCKWGGGQGHRLKGQILNINNNPPEILKQKFNDVISKLGSQPPNIREAIHVMRQVKYLGGISFASKHLRFLFPKLCPVLDKILSEHLLNKPYDKLIDEDYEQFSRYCTDIARRLEEKKIDNPFPGRNSIWYPCDVEAAIFTHVRAKMAALQIPMQ